MCYCNLKTVERGGISCRVYSGNDTILMGGVPGAREFSETESRALVGHLVRNRRGETGRVRAYVELQRPDEEFVYGVEVDWARHFSEDGRWSDEFFEQFADRDLTLLDGAAAEEASREWKRRKEASQGDWDAFYERHIEELEANPAAVQESSNPRRHGDGSA